MTSTTPSWCVSSDDAPCTACLCRPAPLFIAYFPTVLFNFEAKLLALSTCKADSLFQSLFFCVAFMIVSIMVVILFFISIICGLICDLTVSVGWLITCGFCLRCCPWKEGRWGSTGCCMLSREGIWEPYSCSRCVDATIQPMQQQQMV